MDMGQRRFENLERAPSTTSMASLAALKVAKLEISLDGAAVEPTTTHNLEYQETLMYGRYSSNLAEYARLEAKRVRDEERQKEEILFSKELQPYKGKIPRILVKFIRPLWDHTFARLGEDWVFLFILGTVMACISFSVDFIISVCFKARMYLHNELLSDIHWTLQLFAWVTIPTLLVIFSAAFCQWLAPQAAGSGIPEMKTVLRGVILKEYLTWKTLIAKIVGLATVIGAGMPLGKEGPVMHMASILSSMLMNLLSCIKGSPDSEAHSTDLLAAAATMGVAVCYAAPIGGVLFSIEVTTVYFAVRNYWRGFFAAVVGAMFYRMMSVWFLGEETITPLFKVIHNFPMPYHVMELLPFIAVGIISGFSGSLFVYTHRRYVTAIRHNKFLKKCFNKRRLLYPTIISILISAMTFPQAFGQFMAATTARNQQILDLFSNVTWTIPAGETATYEQEQILRHWVMPSFPNIYVSLLIYQIVSIFQIAIASTLPVPNGILIPLLIVGAAFGRMVGEIMVTFYPDGVFQNHAIVPGSYAMVGAAAFCAAVTHTISISVIVFELTGLITYVIPIMVGVLVSNCIASLLQPSIYDSVIRIKKLPYLPDIITTTSDVYSIYVEDIMVRDIKYIWHGITYTEMKKVLKDNVKLKFFPIVDKHDSMILLGSIPRVELVRLLMEQISTDKRKKEAKRRDLEALMKRWQEEDALDILNKRAKIQYEDEVNTSSDEGDGREENYVSNMLNRFSRSLSRSLSRSRSFSRSTSISRQQSPERSDSDSSPTPSSPAASKLKELFPSLIKDHSNKNATSETKSLNEKNKDEDLSEDADRFDTDTNRPESSKNNLVVPKDDDKPTTPKQYKKRSRLDRFKAGGPKGFHSQEKKKLKGHRKVRLTRSNSLDSIRRTSQGKDLPDKGASGKAAGSSEESGKKGILKRRNSLSLGFLPGIGGRNNGSNANGSGVTSPTESNYQTVTVIDHKLRSAIEKVRKMKMDTATSLEFRLSQLALFKSKKKETPKKEGTDLTPEEREVWELRELSKEVDFTSCHIDPAPFQLVERTTLLKVHSLFSMLGINQAYVTAIGRLIGVVALKEVRCAIEGQYTGNAAVNKAPSNSSLVGPSPQRMSSVPPSDLDPEVGVSPKTSPSVFRRHFSSVTNKFSKNS